VTLHGKCTDKLKCYIFENLQLQGKKIVVDMSKETGSILANDVTNVELFTWCIHVKVLTLWCVDLSPGGNDPGLPSRAPDPCVRIQRLQRQVL